jgi:rubrerythrin
MTADNHAPAGRCTRRFGLQVAGAMAAAGIGLLAGSPTTASPAPLGAVDVRVLNYALLLERLQAQFYASAIERAGLKGELRDFATTALAHERQHVDRLSAALGDQADPAPVFTLDAVTGDPDHFSATAIALEDLAVAAYNGQVTNVSRPVLKVAAEIVSVEGRHAAWIRDMAGRLPAPRAADPVLSAKAVLARLQPMGLVQGLGGGT